MNIVVFDQSKGKCFVKTRRYFSKILIRISNRKFVGNLPSRIIEELLFNLKTMISKKSDILILVSHKGGFYGWSGYHFGKTKSKIKYKKFLMSNRYITTNSKNG